VFYGSNLTEGEINQKKKKLVPRGGHKSQQKEKWVKNLEGRLLGVPGYYRREKISSVKKPAAKGRTRIKGSRGRGGEFKHAGEPYVY